MPDFNTGANAGGVRKWRKVAVGISDWGATGRAEVDTLTITSAATAAGDVTVTLDGVAVTVAVALSDTTVAVATKIASTVFTGWTVTRIGAVVTFTSDTTGVKAAPAYSPAETGAAGTIVVTRDGYGTITVPVLGKALFGADGLPIAIPAGVKTIGYLMTDGLSDSKEISTTPTAMLQSVTPVRQDLESIADSFTLAAGESNAYAMAIRYGKLASDFPASKDGAWAFEQGQTAEYPYYTMWMWAKDGTGPKAVYRARVWHKVSLSSIAGRVMNAADPESHGYTFGAFEDELTGLVQIEAQDSPSQVTHLN